MWQPVAYGALQLAVHQSLAELCCCLARCNVIHLLIYVKNKHEVYPYPELLRAVLKEYPRRNYEGSITAVCPSRDRASGSYCSSFLSDK